MQLSLCFSHKVWQHVRAISRAMVLGHTIHMQFVMSACRTLKHLHGTHQPEVCNWGEVRGIVYETACYVADAGKQLDVPQNCPCSE